MSLDRIRARATELLGGLSDLVWPPACLLCDRPLVTAETPRGVCPPCRQSLTSDAANACPRCASSIGPHTDPTDGCTKCRGRKFRFSAATRLGVYDGAVRDAVLRIKHESGEALAEELGRTFAETRGAGLCAAGPQVVVAVPLHWRRRWARGYNQSEAVARALAAALGLPHRSWLRRVKATPIQPSVSEADRWENVKGSFRAARRARLTGVRVLLVDDVLTTGATADAASGALIAAGAAQVTVAVLSHR